MIFWTAVRKELLEQWRTYHFLVVVLVMGTFGLLSPLGAKLTPEFVKLLPQGEAIAKLIPEATISDAADQYIKNTGQFALILVLLMTMGAVVQEKEKGTAALILAKPIPRSTFLGAKFVALGLIFTVGIIAAGLASYYYTLLLLGAPSLLDWLALNVLLLLFLLVHVAVTLFFSTKSRSLIEAGGLSFVAMVILALTNALPIVGEFSPMQLLLWAEQMATDKADQAWFALLAAIGIILISLVAAWADLERQEL